MSKNLKFLMIDDDEYKIKRISSELKEGDKLYESNNYQEGLMLVRNLGDKLDCIILDMQFPISVGESIDTTAGLSVLAELERTKCKIPVVLCTGSSKETIAKLNIRQELLYIIYFDSCYSQKSDLVEIYRLLEEKANEK